MTAPRRADATENRARIVEVAREVLAASDDLKLNAVAKRAGVGQGTLYRHFPTREDLIAEVYRRDLDALITAAPALLAEHGPTGALARWFDRLVDYARVKNGVLTAVEADVWRGLTARSASTVGEALDVLLDAGRADGSVHEDVDARTVITLVAGLGRLGPGEYDERAPVLVRIVLDGIRVST